MLLNVCVIGVFWWFVMCVGVVVCVVSVGIGIESVL